ncbi:glycosyltransferase [Rarobacter faecitabidus]|uniref:glycosyltransferase n=1 Tax=Rarobacter faecitabidus TaxID=13243 RepID=UPI001FE529A1|nr:glycosyltransferase family 2 protein [Rarobacter faecitabidus]
MLIAVPAHDEAELLPRCIASIGAARQPAQRAGMSVDVVIVLDDCTDDSAAQVKSSRVEGLRVEHIRANSVGAARAHGIRRGLAASMAPPEATWIACTDADSEVPPNWIISQVALANRGADLVIGTVRPDPTDLSAEQIVAWQATRNLDHPNGHVHGANLGMRAQSYLAAGGFGRDRVHEDVNLVARIRALPAITVVASAEADVLTSGRRDARAPDGYARYLHRDLLRETREPVL